MPTIRREGPYRFFFYASDREEPPHVHVERDQQTAKFWLCPVRLQDNGGFRPAEIRRITKIVTANENSFKDGWDEYFDA